MTRQEYNREASSQATCNWVEVRNQAAIAAMQSMIVAFYERQTITTFSSLIVENAMDYANKLVKQLKGE